MSVSACRARLLPLLVLLLCLIAPGASADTEGAYTYDYDEALGGASITGYTGSAANVAVPDTLGGYPVRRMGFFCFQSNASVVSVTLPESLRELDGAAFDGCSSLERVYLPQNLTSFVNSYVPSDVRYIVARGTATAHLITNTADTPPSSRFFDPEWPDFALCYIINDTTGAAELGVARYTGTSTEVTVPDGVVRIGQNAFLNAMDSPACANLTAVTLPDSVTAIDSNAFGATYALKALTLSDNISSWGSNLFGLYRDDYPVLYCSADSTTARTMTADACPQGYVDPAQPDWSWAMGGSVITGYRGSAAELVLPEGVTGIGGMAFRGNQTLVSLTLPDSVTSIGSRAFEGASMLKTIHLSDNISEWGELLFGYTSAYPTLYCSAGSTTARTLPASSCPQGYTDPADPDWSWAAGEGRVLTGYHGSATKLRLPDDVTAIGDRAFYDNRTLACIIVPESVRSIGSQAFDVDFTRYAGNESAYCQQHVYLPDGVTSAGSSLGYTQRTTFHLSLGSRTASAIVDSGSILHVVDDAMPEWDWCLTPDGPYYAGYTGPDLSVEVPDIARGVCGYVSTPALYGKRQLINAIRLPEGLTTITEYAFYTCCSLERISLPSTLTSIGPGAFADCRSLTHLEIPEGVVSLPEQMCLSCGSLAYVTLPDSVTSIADSAFEGCTLKKVYCSPGSYAETWAKGKGLSVGPLTSASARLVIPSTSNTFFHVGDLYDWRMHAAVIPPLPDTPCTLSVTSSNPAIISVEGDYLRARQSGQVTLTFTCPELGLSKSGKYAAFYPVKDFSLKKAYYVKLGSAITIKPLSISPAENAYMAFFFACGNPGQPGYESENNQFALSASDVTWLGKGIHSLSAVSASGVTRTSRLVVYSTLGARTFDPFTGPLYPGMTVYPHITVTFDSTVVQDDPAFYTLTSSNPSIAQPTEDGGLRLLAPGTATITAALPGSVTRKQTITVANENRYVLPAGLVRLEDEAFYACPASIVVLPGGCQSIGARAFADCPRLRRIEIPSSVSSIAEDALDGCDLSSLTFVTPAGSYAAAWAAARGISVLSE